MYYSLPPAATAGSHEANRTPSQLSSSSSSASVAAVSSFHQVPHSAPSSHQIPVSLYHNSTPANAPMYRDAHYHDRQEYAMRYAAHHDIQDVHHMNSSHSQAPVGRRRPSLLPSIIPNEHSYTNIVMQSSYVNRMERERYNIDQCRYGMYSDDRKGPYTNVPLIMGNPLSSGLSQAGLQLNHAIPGHLQQQQQHQQHPSAGLAFQHYMSDNQEMLSKRPRLFMENKTPINQQLLVDTRNDVEVKKDQTYTPQVEAISPTLPNEDVRQDVSPTKNCKDEVVQNLHRIDREIAQTEAQINNLKKRQIELEAVTSQSTNDKSDNSDGLPESKQLSIAQIIYSENRRKANESHRSLDKMGPKIDLPLYNQPSDVKVYRDNIESFIKFKSKLITHLKGRHEDKIEREKYITENYENLMKCWLKKLEKKELNPAKKAKDAKFRELFEKQFPELRKHREEKDRLLRAGHRIRSDADFDYYMDGLQEQELEDKKMRSYAVIPPIMLDEKSRKYKFINRNGLVEDPVAEFKQIQLLNMWTDSEKEIFKEKFLQNPKNFGLIASFLERKSIADCVQYYYLSKKSANYKQLLRKHVKKRTRALVKAQQQEQQQQQQNQQQQQLVNTKGNLVIPPVLSNTIATISSSSSSSTTTTSSTTATATTTTVTASITNAKTTTTTVATSINSVVKEECSTSVTSHVVTSTIVSSCSSTSTTLSSTSSSSTTSLTNNSQTTTLVYSSSNNNNSSANGPISCSIEKTNDKEEKDVRCCICDALVENKDKSRQVTAKNCHFYGIRIENVKENSQICIDCRFKNVRHDCPLGSCRTPRRKVKRLKNLPLKWFELKEEVRRVYAAELKIPEGTTRCCTRCVQKVSRRIGAVSPSLKSLQEAVSNNYGWSEDEIKLLKDSLRQNGKNWPVLSSIIGTKTVENCRKFYFKFKYKLKLDQIVKAYLEMNGGQSNSRFSETDSEEYWNEASDSEETSSAEEGNERSTSDTASASSPPIPKSVDCEKLNVEKINSNINNNNASVSSSVYQDYTKLQELKGLSASQGSLKSDYDSSATMSADEGQGGIGESDLRNISPPRGALPPRANSAVPVLPSNNHVMMHYNDKTRPASNDSADLLKRAEKFSERIIHPQQIPSFLISPHAPSCPPNISVAQHHQLQQQLQQQQQQCQVKGEPTSVRDLINQAIEASLQTPVKNQRIDEQNYRAEENKLPRDYNLVRIKREPPSDYKISPPAAHDSLRVQYSYPRSGGDVLIEPDDEVQDLSKKDKKVNYNIVGKNFQGMDVSSRTPPLSMNSSNQGGFGYSGPPPAHSNQISRNSSNNVAMELTKESTDLFMHRGQDYRRDEKSIEKNDYSVLMNHSNEHQMRQLNQMKAAGNNNNFPPLPPPPLITTVGKPMLSSQAYPPKAMFKEKISPISSGGSITEGTPVLSTHQSAATPPMCYQPGRFEGLVRHYPPKDSGSITLGTPVISQATVKRKTNEPMYEAAADQYYRKISPSSSGGQGYQGKGAPVYLMPGFTPPPPPPSQSLSQGSSSMSKLKFNPESQLSMNQIMIDFNTSKQMQIRRDSFSSEKEFQQHRQQQQQHHAQQQQASPSVPSRLQEAGSPQVHHQQQQQRMGNVYSNYPTSGTPTVQGPGHLQSPLYMPHDLRYSNATNISERTHTPSGQLSPSQWHLKNQQMANYGNAHRQNVIQQWSAPGSKPSVIQTPKSCSPKTEYRHESISPSFQQSSSSSAAAAAKMMPRYQVPIQYPSSHDAFQTLVNAAVAQQNLAVPGKEERRGVIAKNEMRQVGSEKHVEGLEKSLLEMHQRPRAYIEMSKDQSGDLSGDERMKYYEGRNEKSISEINNETRSRIESMTKEKVRLLNENLMQQHHQQQQQQQQQQQSSLRLGAIREPVFSSEQFERELRQQDVKRGGESYSKNTLNVDEASDLSLSNRNAMMMRQSELENEASKVFTHGFQKDNQKGNCFTAASIIDAIITKSINHSSDNQNAKKGVVGNSSSNPAGSRPPFPTVGGMYGKHQIMQQHQQQQQQQNYHQQQAREEMQSNYGDRNENIATNLMISKNANIKPYNLDTKHLGENKLNYPNSSNYPQSLGVNDSRNSSPRMLEGIAAAVASAPRDNNQTSSNWKLRKALQSEKSYHDSPENSHHSNLHHHNAMLNVVRESERSESRGGQAQEKSRLPIVQNYNVEPISPPIQASGNENREKPVQMPMMASSFSLTNSPRSGLPSIKSENDGGGRTNLSIFPLEYVKNKIVEVMRKTSNDGSEEKNIPQSTAMVGDPMREHLEKRYSKYASEYGMNRKPRFASSSSSSVVQSSSIKIEEAGQGVRNPALDATKKNSSPSNSINDSHQQQQHRNNEQTENHYSPLPRKRIRLSAENYQFGNNQMVENSDKTDAANMPGSGNRQRSSSTENNTQSLKTDDNMKSTQNGISSTQQKQASCDVSSGGREHEMSSRSTHSPSSPGEMVIDECMSTGNMSSSPLEEKVDSSDRSGSVRSTDKQRNSKDEESSVIREQNTNETPNQSHSVSSSLNNLMKDKRSPTDLKASSSSSQKRKEMTGNSEVNSSETETQNYHSAAAAVSSASSNIHGMQQYSQSPSSSSGGNFSNFCNGGGVSSNNFRDTNGRYYSFPTNNFSYSPLVSSNVSASNGNTVQSSTVSASGSTTTTVSSQVAAPQYEPLSDDE